MQLYPQHMHCIGFTIGGHRCKCILTTRIALAPLLEDIDSVMLENAAYCSPCSKRGGSAILVSLAHACSNVQHAGVPDMQHAP